MCSAPRRDRLSALPLACLVAGDWIGSSLGKAFDGQKLLFLFALLMIVIGALMRKGRDTLGNPQVSLKREIAPKIAGLGAITGLFPGFFGIGGVFLIVPGLIASSGMPMLNAVGSSLVAVTAFGLTTSLIFVVAAQMLWQSSAAFRM